MCVLHPFERLNPGEEGKQENGYFCGGNGQQGSRLPVRSAFACGVPCHGRLEKSLFVFSAEL